MDTLDIINECLKGDRISQRKLIEQFGSKLMVVCKRYSNKTLEPNDIFQESWIKIFASLKKFDPEKGEFQAWIYRIAVNEALQLLRKNLKYNHLEDLSDPVVESSSSQKEELTQNVDYQALLKVIETLPEWQKVVFNMYAIEGYDHNEIGEKLGISASTSRSQLTRARKKLKELTKQLYA